MSFKQSLFAGMLSVPIAFTGIVGSAFAHTGTPPAVVAPDQVAAQKLIVQKAFEALKAAHAKLAADLKVEPALPRETIKTDHEALRTAMKTFRQEVMKLPEADRGVFQEQIKALIKEQPGLGRGMHRQRKAIRHEGRDERRDERRGERREQFGQFRERSERHQDAR